MIILYYSGEGDDTSSISSGDATESIVKDLSKALLQIQHGIESKYLVMPLGRLFLFLAHHYQYAITLCPLSIY